VLSEPTSGITVLLGHAAVQLMIWLITISMKRARARRDNNARTNNQTITVVSLINVTISEEQQLYFDCLPHLRFQ
jgi:hypothetical protein